ncbi:MAG: DUF4465 domain-containing protein [Bacteroidia bacterium]|nr:DUF4465 domain-containing protein [Bacteroidia bacterium]
MKKHLPFLGVFLLLVLSTTSKAQSSATFENISLAPNSYYNGSDFAGGFKSGDFYFQNSYDSSFGGFWSGFSVSNVKDDSTKGFMNQYSAITGGGLNSENYGVFYGNGKIKLEGNAIGKVVNGFYITNSTYAYYDMKEGSTFTKKFGGVSGNDPDYFKVEISAWKNSGNPADTSVEIYLADFRFSNNTDDYILNTWKWVDLSSFGAVDSFAFNFYSSDTGDFGINTPLYFCLDNFGDMPNSIKKANKNMAINVYPNPSKSIINVESAEPITRIEIYNMNGQLLLSNNETSINIESLHSGIYILTAKNELGTITKKIIKE